MLCWFSIHTVCTVNFKCFKIIWNNIECSKKNFAEKLKHGLSYCFEICMQQLWTYIQTEEYYMKMSYDNALNKLSRLLSELIKFYSVYKPALENLEKKETQITAALQNLADAKRTLHNTQIDIRALRYFCVPGTIQEVQEHIKYLYENQDKSSRKVEEYETVVLGLLQEPGYIELKLAVEKVKVLLNYYQSRGLFR